MWMTKAEYRARIRSMSNPDLYKECLSVIADGKDDEETFCYLEALRRLSTGTAKTNIYNKALEDNDNGPE